MHIALSLARRHRDFTTTDACVLGLLGPHFAATLKRLHQLALTHAILAGLQAGGDRWVVLINSADIVASASDGAEEALGVRIGEDLLLLDPSLTVTRVPNAYPELDALHIARTPRPDAQTLRRLGLTQRQSEVLALATRGLSARQIADKLVLSRRTVEKHFAAIYTSLRVNTRAQAIAAAITATHTCSDEAESWTPITRAPLRIPER